jgi:hypothetical protein
MRSHHHRLQNRLPRSRGARQSYPGWDVVVIEGGTADSDKALPDAE